MISRSPWHSTCQALTGPTREALSTKRKGQHQKLHCYLSSNRHRRIPKGCAGQYQHPGYKLQQCKLAQVHGAKVLVQDRAANLRSSWAKLTLQPFLEASRHSEHEVLENGQRSSRLCLCSRKGAQVLSNCTKTTAQRCPQTVPNFG